MTDYSAGNPTVGTRPVTGNSAAAAVEHISEKVSDAGDKANAMASRAADKMASVGRQAANRFDATTQYFRDRDAKAIASDARNYARTHPAQALIGAAALGFLFAVALRRR